jgi:hypothetical protein
MKCSVNMTHPALRGRLSDSLCDAFLCSLWHDRFEVLSFIIKSFSERKIAVELQVYYHLPLGAKGAASAVRAVDPPAMETEQIPFSL